MLSLNTMYAALPARDIKEAMEFYGNTLGLTLVDQNRHREVQFVKRELEGSKREGYVNHFPSFDAAWFRDPSGNLICITHHL